MDKITITKALVFDVTTELGLITSISPSGDRFDAKIINDCYVHLDDDIGKASRLLFQLAKVDVRFTGTFATSTGSIHSRFPGVSKASLIDNPQAAFRFVEDKVAEGADYIQIVADVPGMSQEVVNTLVIEARKRRTLTVAYAARNGALS
ncbi:hypothetical protein F5882DRAFT_378767 [Hyaloscypha sp. PMI_1271]|nr:hypothetical protein F5882DRAFT_378767 [Hyaloscypha sp. PMI_1271]